MTDPTQMPHSHGVDQSGTNLISDGTYRYAMWYSSDLTRVFFGRQALSGGAWSIHEFTGANATALALPILDDDHNYCSIALLGDGKAAVFANMHTHPLRALISTNAVASDITAWSTLAASAFSGMSIRCTYPMPIHRPDGSVRFYMREGPEGSGSSRSDSAFWDCPAGSSTFGAKTSIFKGLSVANAKGAGIPGDDHMTNTEYNWNAYPAVPVVQDVGGGEFIEHWAWCWRQGSDARSNIKPSYMQYRSVTDSWHTIDGTAVTLPVDPVNTTSVQMGLTDDGEGYLNFGGLCVDDDGTPHLLISMQPWYYVTWNGSTWIQETKGSVGAAWNYLGLPLTGRVLCIWLRGSMWFMGSGYRLPYGRQTLWRYGGVTGERVTITGDVSSGWEVAPDWNRWRDVGVLEFLYFAPNGKPSVVSSFGNGVRMAAA